MGQRQAQRPTEHDVIIQALSVTLSERDRVAVERTSRTDDATNRSDMPDLVLRHPKSRRLLRVVAIETRWSMSRARSERWELFATFAPLTLVVPKGAAREAERLLSCTEARIVEYEGADTGNVVFRPAI